MLKRLYVLLSFFAVFFDARAQCLTGSYTIGGASPNYATITSAVNALTSQGVCGPVTFNINPGTYFENITVPAITGASNINTVTFKAANNDSSSVVVTYSNTISSFTNNFVMKLGGSFITLQYLTITQQSTAGSSCLYLASTMTNKAQSCVFNNGGATDALIYSDCLSGNIYVNNCAFNGGSFGIDSYNSSARMYVKNCQFNNQSGYGIYGMVREIGQNTITTSSANGNSYNIYAHSGNDTLLVYGNKITANGGTGMWVSTNASRIYNNYLSIQTGSPTSYATSALNWNSMGAVNTFIEIYNNTFLFKDNTAGSAALSLQSYSNTKCVVKNNIVINSAQTYLYDIYITAGLIQSDSNCLFSYGNANATKFYVNGTSYKSFYSYISSGQDLHSNYKVPAFAGGPGYLIAHDIDLYGKGTKVSYIATDIDGNLRNGQHSCIGAHEFTLLQTDAYIDKVVLFDSALCAGSHNLTVRLKNSGSDTLRSVDFDWKANAGAFQSFTWNGTLATGDSTFATLGTYNPDVHNTNNILAYVTQANGTNDLNQLNDTVRISKRAHLSGVYTIAATGADFPSFNAAVTTMVQNGICGPVDFKVADGMYTEHFTVTPVPGASPVNTITFESQNGDSSLVTLADSNYTLVNLVSSYVTFKKLGFLNRSNYNYPTISMEATNTNITNCHFVVRLGQSFAINSYSTVSPEYLAITNNYFTPEATYTMASSVAINVANSSNTIGKHILISGNVIKDFPEAIAVSYADSLSITSNLISFSQSSLWANTAVSVSSIGDHLFINNNNISGGFNQYAIDIQNVVASGSAQRIVKNNMCNTSGSGAVYLWYANNVEFYFNTFNLNSQFGACLFRTSYSKNNILKNNIFNSTGTSALIGDLPTNQNTYDFNNYHSLTDSAFILPTPAAYSTFSQWQQTSHQDYNSTAYDPQFVSASDLHINNDINLNAKGISISGINVDYDGDLRGSSPDMGADEFNAILLANDAAIMQFDPATAACDSSSTPIKVKVFNNGNDTLYSVAINWAANGVAQPPYNWAGTLAPGTFVYVNIGNLGSSIATQYMLTAYSTLPNGATDPNPQNDTAFSTPLKPSLGGVYTVGGNSADFNTISTAAAYLKAYGVCAPVVFNINSGSYTENIELDSVRGASLINTITFQSAAKNFNNVWIHGASNVGTTLKLVGADYFTFKHLSFTSTGTSTSVMSYTLGCNYLTFDSVQFIAQTPIIGSDHLDHNTTFDHCFFYTSVHVQGNSTTREKGLKFMNCSLSAADGLTLTLCDSALLSGNRFIGSGIAGNSNGIRLSSCGSSVDVTKNYIQGQFGNGISIDYAAGTSARHVLVANNSIAGGTNCMNGIICDYSYYVDLLYNSCFLTNSSPGGGPVTVLSNNNITALNNIFSNSGGGYAASIYNGSQFANSDYNIFYTTGSSQIYYNGSGVTLASYKSSTSKEAHSSLLDPQFYSLTDLHYNNSALNGLAIPVMTITDDIQNKIRNATTPNPGAFESPPDTVYDAVNKDLWVTSATNTLTLGASTITMTFVNDTVQNYDPYHIYTGTIDSIDVYYKMNNGPWVSQLWTGNLTIQQSATHTFTVPYNVPKGKIYWLTVKAKIHSSSAVDINPSNDTLRNQIIIPMAGTYYVGGLNPDFSTGDSALYHLNTCHETAAVTFAFRPGHYDLMWIQGFDTLTVTSDNGNATSVTLDCGQILATNLSIRKVSIKAFQNQGCGGYYTDLGIATSSFKLLVDSCIIFGYNTGTAQTNGFWVFASSDVTITHNLFKNLGISVVYIDINNICGIGSGWGGRHLIAYNTFDSVQTAIKIETPFGGSVNPSDSVHFCYNTVKNSGIGVYVAGYNSMLARVYGNRIDAIHSAIKINPGYAAIPYYNNFLSGGDTLRTGAANEFAFLNTVELWTAKNQEFTNNSVYGSIRIEGGQNNVLNNNTVFADTMMALEINGPSNYVGDHNNYFSNGRYLASLFNTTGLPDLDSLKVYTTSEQHSISHNPYYYSTTDLHSNSAFLQNAGSYNATVTIDCDGQLRSSPPDIGADEIGLVADVVWPGDANANSKADNTDFLSIGLYNGATGTSRPLTGNTWSPHISTNWNLTQYDSVDYKHADCNGDGIIDDNDTLAIVQNYALSHNTNTRSGHINQEFTSGNDLYFVMPNPKATYSIGDTIYAEIWLGHPAVTISNIYGIAFSIYTYGPSILPGSFVVQMENSWLGTPHLDAYGFGKTKEDVGVAGAVIVRKDHMNVSGGGKIGYMSFIYNGNAPSQGIELDLVNVTAVDASGNQLNVNAHSNNANNYMPFNIGVDELALGGEKFMASPNPFAGSTTISYTLASEDRAKLEIFDAMGRLVSTIADQKQGRGPYSYKFDAAALGLRKGVYLAKLTLSSRVSLIRIIYTE